METTAEQVTLLLDRWAGGDAGALAKATELLYPELHRLADSYFRRERPGHTLQPTALVHEAFLRLLRIDHLEFENRRQFLGLMAQLMRQILVDYARQANAQKRGGDARHVGIDQTDIAAPDYASRFLELNDALNQLAQISERKARILELRYFAGLSLEEVGTILEISAATVSRDQHMAEAWLNEAIHGRLQM
ncbi:ECF-type sigma factor [Paludibaculum fermentans]|uniref:Sigma-70 family RNA polymerase sigma factor n=1 Tax=Paludibaculum fermentans TaxID=1473598 RepID=A0A7S7NQN8_PALFE|nr:ECF-type sigma factor [Paludibaculum fermentans]QOY87539.1 sigma-70 family RNA polymerase sigma factor [Paludibaculum fermentans]